MSISYTKSYFKSVGIGLQIRLGLAAERHLEAKGKSMSLKLKYIIILLSVVNCMPISGWAANKCESVYSAKLVSSKSRQFKIPEDKQHTFELYRKMNQTGELASVLSDNTVGFVLSNKDLPEFGNKLEKILVEMNETQKVTAADFLRIASRILKSEDIPKRLIDKGFKEHHPKSIKTLYRLLGSLTIHETREMYTGYASGLKFTKSSLLGKYIQETGAFVTIRSLPRLVKSDVEAHNYELEKLVVSVSAGSFKSFIKHFGKKTMFSSFAHGAIIHDGKAFDVWGKIKNLEALYVNTPMPIALLKPSEGERMSRYLNLITKYTNWQNELKQPWRLGEYVQKGQYTCCTNFIGNIPIGDKLVSEYHLPNPTGIKDVVPKLKSWNKTDSNSDLSNVWTVPGHEQLSSVIGQLDANIAGEFASPGWVIQTLMLTTSNERVPIVFVFSNDHTAPLPEVLNLSYEYPR